MWFLYVEDILFTLDVVLQLWRSLYYIGIEKKEETNIRYESYLVYVLLN